MTASAAPLWTLERTLRRRWRWTAQTPVGSMWLAQMQLDQRSFDARRDAIAHLAAAYRDIAPKPTSTGKLRLTANPNGTWTTICRRYDIVRHGWGQWIVQTNPKASVAAHDLLIDAALPASFNGREEARDALRTLMHAEWNALRVDVRRAVAVALRDMPLRPITCPA